MNRNPKDSSVFEEPHLQGNSFSIDPSEDRAAENLCFEIEDEHSTDEEIERSVWDEPSLSIELAGPPPKNAPTYQAWLQKRAAETTAARSWAITFLLAAVAGPWAILGAFYSAGGTVFSLLAMIVVGPVVEEMMKIAAALYVVEKKPYLFRSPFQIAVCVLAAAFMFAMIENILYLNFYIPTPSSLMVSWRWTVCTALHLGCSMIAGLGLIQVWRDVWERKAAPRLTRSYPYILTAVIVHGSYNALAILSETTFHF